MRPIAAANSGKLVLPRRTVSRARSETFCTASTDVSPYALVTADVRSTASATVATPAVAARELMARICIVRPASSPKAEMVW